MPPAVRRPQRRRVVTQAVATSRDGRLLEALLDVVAALVVVLDRSGTVVGFNRACERATGFAAEEILGTKLWDRLIADDEIEGVRAVFDELSAGRFPNAHDNDWFTKSGERRHVSWSNTALLDADGSVEWVIGTGIDVTETRRNARALVESELRYRRILETANEGVWIIDVDGHFTFINEKMAAMLGATISEAAAQSLWDFIDEDWRDAARRHLGARSDGARQQHDVLFRHRDGSALYAIVNTNPISDGHGRFIGTLGMVTDITERRTVEERQRRLTAELDHRVKNALATVVALAEETSRSTSSVEVYRDTLGARIRMMARAHEALARSAWQGVHFDELAFEVLLPFARDARIQVGGPDVHLPPFVTLPLALTLHELTTNSVKHGALAADQGVVRLEWKLETPDLLRIAWRESGGPRVTATPTEGIGLALVRDFVEYELGGGVALAFAPSGFACDLEIPLSTRTGTLLGTAH